MDLIEDIRELKISFPMIIDRVEIFKMEIIILPIWFHILENIVHFSTSSNSGVPSVLALCDNLIPWPFDIFYW